MIYETKNIRNVTLLGHPGSGKTTFAETMLFEAGAIKRRGVVEDKSTVSDYTNIEQERGNSLFSTLMHASWKDSKINILDTPGFDDFIGEVISSLRVSDTAIMLLNAKSGVEVGTELIWDYIEKYKTPTLFVVNQIDHEKANYENTVEEAQARFGSKVIPFQFPIESDAGFNSIVDALRMTMYVFPADGGKPEKAAIPDSVLEKAEDLHQQIVEAAAENDEGLMERFFDEGTLSEEEIAKGLQMAIAQQEIFPLFICSSTQNMGSGRIMGFINDICPAPADVPPAQLEDGELICDSSDSTSVFIFKTISEPRVGNVSYFKVYSGALNAGDELVNASNRGGERFGQIFVANGKARDIVNTLKAGDLGVTVKLKNTHTNQTLNAKGTDRKIKEIVFPESRIRVAVDPPSKDNMEKLMKALHIIEEEDPTLIIEQSKTLKQTLLHGQGQLHLDLIKYRIEKVNGVSMDFIRPKIPYRETITKVANGSYRHKKQSGGAGQFGEVHMRLEPYQEGMAPPSGLTVRREEEEELPWGGILKFLWCIVGGSIDAKYINAIKKGILQRMEEGPLSGSYCQDIRVCIYDGKMHPVDSNDNAFTNAARMAFRNIFQDAGPKLMEPIYTLDILCDGEVLGDVNADLQTRRGIIIGMGVEGRYQKVTAHVPLAELYKYSASLRSLTQGRAKFRKEFYEYQAVPRDIQDAVVSAHKSGGEED